MESIFEGSFFNRGGKRKEPKIVMRKMKAVQGFCKACKLSLNPAAMGDHLKTCSSITKAYLNAASGEDENYPSVPSIILRISSQLRDWKQRYWIYVAAPKDLPLTALDSFIKSIWVECCGHNSGFRHRGMTVSRLRPIGATFYPTSSTNEIDYIYDFGTPTELTIEYVADLPGFLFTPANHIIVLARNKQARMKCHVCEQMTAKWIYTSGGYDFLPTCTACKVKYTEDDDGEEEEADEEENEEGEADEEEIEVPVQVVDESDADDCDYSDDDYFSDEDDEDIEEGGEEMDVDAEAKEVNKTKSSKRKATKGTKATKGGTKASKGKKAAKAVETKKPKRKQKKPKFSYEYFIPIVNSPRIGSCGYDGGLSSADCCKECFHPDMEEEPVFGRSSAEQDTMDRENSFRFLA